MDKGLRFTGGVYKLDSLKPNKPEDPDCSLIPTFSPTKPRTPIKRRKSGQHDLINTP